ncbi:lipoprotein, putative [Moritella sp. PE36]|uniref:L,D-transpeptidase family protein n=1 Tax=Moritella sp. PE36 TaxID=58051 RepID=UPI000156870F|nr:L,D-transpeptidase family protein [Moritella sp. PE36]EDM67730.1 lipoprotein, putative [Moritella sp. PE36]
MALPLALFLLVILSLNSYASQLLQADYVLVKKSDRTLFLFRNNQLIKSYRISLGKNPIGAKTQRGDKKTPEGLYNIDFKNRQSKYHLSLHITYPNKRDKERSFERNLNPGDSIYIHGLPNKNKNAGLLIGSDWTNGCIAVSNNAIRDIAKYVPDGTPIQITP